MDAQREQHEGGDPVAADIESRNPDSGDIVAGEQVLDEGHIAPDQDAESDSTAAGSPPAGTEGGGPHTGAAEGERETPEQRRSAADERTDAAAPPEVEEPG